MLREVGAPTVLGPAGPVAPVAPVAPVDPTWPWGMLKLNTAALDVPAFVTVADDPAAPVVTVPTAMVAAAPLAPFAPELPVAPVLPTGMPKFSTAAELVPEFVTVALDPGARVETVPTETVAALPGAPGLPELPGVPAGPCFTTLATIPGGVAHAGVATSTASAKVTSRWNRRMSPAQ